MRLLFTLALALLTLIACDSNDDADSFSGRYEATTLELPRAADGTYNALVSGGQLELTFSENGRLAGTFSPGRDDSNGPNSPTVTIEFTDSYSLSDSTVVLNTTSLPESFPRTFKRDSERISAELFFPEGGYRIVLERQ